MRRNQAVLALRPRRRERILGIFSQIACSPLLNGSVFCRFVSFSCTKRGIQSKHPRQGEEGSHGFSLGRQPFRRIAIHVTINIADRNRLS